MDSLWLASLAVGFGLALVFMAGYMVSRHVGALLDRRRVCSIITADDHRNEAARLLYESIHYPGRDPQRRYERYLQSEAFRHFQLADIIENGPYAGVDKEDDTL